VLVQNEVAANSAVGLNAYITNGVPVGGTLTNDKINFGAWWFLNLSTGVIYWRFNDSSLSSSRLVAVTTAQNERIAK
jgi:hypothetical protein